jgi:hypothetical protein
MTFIYDLKSSPHVINLFAQETFLNFLWRDLGTHPTDKTKHTHMHTHTHFYLLPFFYIPNQNVYLKWNSTWLQSVLMSFNLTSKI